MAGRLRGTFGAPRGIRTTGLPAQGMVHGYTTPGLARVPPHTSVPMIALMNDVTLRIRPRFTIKNFRPLATVPVLIASMARNTLVANTPQALQRKAPVRLSTQTGRY
jgi:hypothetical protein